MQPLRFLRMTGDDVVLLPAIAVLVVQFAPRWIGIVDQAPARVLHRQVGILCRCDVDRCPADGHLAMGSGRAGEHTGARPPLAVLRSGHADKVEQRGHQVRRLHDAVPATRLHAGDAGHQHDVPNLFIDRATFAEPPMCAQVGAVVAGDDHGRVLVPTGGREPLQ